MLVNTTNAAAIHTNSRARRTVIELNHLSDLFSVATGPLQGRPFSAQRVQGSPFLGCVHYVGYASKHYRTKAETYCFLSLATEKARSLSLLKNKINWMMRHCNARIRGVFEDWRLGRQRCVLYSCLQASVHWARSRLSRIIMMQRKLKDGASSRSIWRKNFLHA